MGARLLERDNRRVVLTAAGTAFLQDARRMLALAEPASVTARRVSCGDRGLVAAASRPPPGTAPWAPC
ncbi:hypothetical protein [Kineococcus sp. SYSU DK003]|uniref:hypothetical protein n=1 Tax=Kineococcus sp. SYSU DK003 TaxID=3383124 RepID=UPI003D7CE0D3